MGTSEPGTPTEGQRTSSPPTHDIKRIVSLALLVLVAAWLIAFILSNSETVRVSFVFGHVSLSLIWVMVICAVLGALIALAVAGISGLSRRRRD